MHKTQELYIQKIEKAMDSFLPSASDERKIVTDAMQYSVHNGGKRIRPILTLEFCRVCGGDIENALPFACAVEMIHTYSLIHDDLPCMDDDDLRRGKPSCHKAFGEAYALLAGDALLTYAFETLTKAENVSEEAIVRAVRTLSNLAGTEGMIGGQVIDLISEENTPDLDTLNRIDAYKTGALIKSAVLLGCIAAEVTDEAVLNAASVYAESIGLAFQIVDDILDVTSSTEELGKPVGSDDKNDKMTFVKLLGIEKCKAWVNDLTNRAVEALDVLPGDSTFLKDLAYALAERKN